MALAATRRAATTAASPSAGMARVSASTALQLVCTLLRSAVGLARPQLLHAEHMRLAKMHAPCMRDEEEHTTEEGVAVSMLRLLHHLLLLYPIPPPASASASATPAAAAAVATPSLPLVLADRVWQARSSDDAVACWAVCTLHDAGYHALCRGRSGSQSCSGSSLPASLLSSRRLLLAVGWVVWRAGVLERSVAAASEESKRAWFAPPIQQAAKLLPSPPPQPQPQQRVQGGKGGATQLQPPLPPARWDHAAAHGQLAVLEQDQEWRLLQQLMAARTQATASPASSQPPMSRSRSTAASRGTSTAHASQHAMCLPPPNGVSDQSYATARLQQRLQQCVLAHGRIDAAMQKLANVQQIHADTIVKLQLTQRHPALRGPSAAPLSPFELQLLHHPPLLSATHDALLQWTSEWDGLAGLASSNAAGTHDSGNSVAALEHAIDVFWQWMASVAQREADEQQQQMQSDTAPQIEPSLFDEPLRLARHAATSLSASQAQSRDTARSVSRTRHPAAAVSPSRSPTSEASRSQCHPLDQVWRLFTHLPPTEAEADSETHPAIDMAEPTAVARSSSSAAASASGSVPLTRFLRCAVGTHRAVAGDAAALVESAEASDAAAAQEHSLDLTSARSDASAMTRAGSGSGGKLTWLHPQSLELAQQTPAQLSDTQQLWLLFVRLTRRFWSTHCCSRRMQQSKDMTRSYSAFTREAPTSAVTARAHPSCVQHYSPARRLRALALFLLYLMFLIANAGIGRLHVHHWTWSFLYLTLLYPPPAYEHGGDADQHAAAADSGEGKGRVTWRRAAVRAHLASMAALGILIQGLAAYGSAFYFISIGAC